MKHTVTKGPYGLIRVGNIYFNSNGIYNLKLKKISLDEPNSDPFKCGLDIK